MIETIKFLFDQELFSTLISVFSYGAGIGFMVGFIAWGFGIAFAAFIKWVKMA